MHFHFLSRILEKIVEYETNMRTYFSDSRVESFSHVRSIINRNIHGIAQIPERKTEETIHLKLTYFEFTINKVSHLPTTLKLTDSNSKTFLRKILKICNMKKYAKH